MASLILHEIIGELYCEKNGISDRENFLSGNIAPDILPTDKNANHYTSDHNYSIYLDAIKGRVNLTRFCKEDNIDTIYRKGYFLHLVTDYIFYERLIISNIRFADFIVSPYFPSAQKMYKDYERVAYYVCSNYPNIDISKLPSFATPILEEPMLLFTNDEISKFIEICSSINIEELFKQISDNNYQTLNKIDFN